MTPRALPPSRRAFASGLALAPTGAFATMHPAQPRSDGLLAFAADAPAPIDLHALLRAPLRVRAVELWRMPHGDAHLVRVISEDGVEGVVRASTKAAQTSQFFALFVVPHLVGADVRDLHRLLEERYRTDYEYAGLPWWSAWGQAEIAVWDMIGKTLGRRCCDLFGPVQRERIAIYLSSNRRDTSPEQEIALLEARAAETGARAIKLKIGRRMGRNADAAPGRSEAIIARARRTFGESMTIYADANGAYDAPTAIAVTHMLKHYGVDLLEEPCPFEDFEMTAQAAAGAAIKIAGGENDYAFERWRWYCARGVFDVVQPDLMYNGGALRCIAVQRMARAAGLGFAPHFPRNNADCAPMLHLCAGADNLYGFQEYRARPDALDYAHAPVMAPVGGEMAVPPGPGWGVAFDPALWRAATRIVPA